MVESLLILPSFLLSFLPSFLPSFLTMKDFQKLILLSFSKIAKKPFRTIGLGVYYWVTRVGVS